MEEKFQCRLISIDKDGKEHYIKKKIIDAEQASEVMFILGD